MKLTISSQKPSTAASSAQGNLKAGEFISSLFSRRPPSRRAVAPAERD
jgi:hypothetical protein